jgi:uncharacterized protein
MYKKMKADNSKKIIEQVSRIVEDACLGENNIFGYGIWTHHIKQVVRIGKDLAEIFNADPEIVEIAALLHDYAGIKDYSLHREHHIHSVTEAEKILKRFNYPDDKINSVLHCIANHRSSVMGNRSTPEVVCLANADAIAHIENVPSLFYLTYSKFKMPIDDGTDWIYKKLNRSWKKISPEIKYLIEEKYKSAINLLSHLTQQN